MKPKNQLLLKLLVAACAAALLAAFPVTAATITKASTGTDLTAGANWTGGIAPGSSDLAVWDTGSLGAGLTLNAGTPSWSGIKVNAGASDPISVGSGGTLTLGTSGIDLSAAAINATFSSGLTLGSGNQVWNIPSGRTLTLNTGTFTRNTGRTLNFQNSGTLASTMTGLTGTGDASTPQQSSLSILGPWATIGSGSSTAYALINSSGNVVAYTSANPASTGTPGWSSSAITAATGTQNFDVTAATDTTYGSSTRNVNTARYNNSSACTLSLGSSSASTLVANGIMNIGGGTLTIQRGASSTAFLTIGPKFELVLNAANGAIIVTAPIANSGSTASAFTINGGSGASGTVTLGGTVASTYTGGTYVNSGTLTVTSTSATPLGMGNVAVNSGGTLNPAAATSTTVTLANTVTGSGNISTTGAGSTLITGDESGFTGTFTHNISGGSVQFNSATSGSANAAYNLAQASTASQGLIAALAGDYTVNLGSLSGVANSLIRGGNSVSGTTTFSIGNLGTSSTFAGVIANGTTKTIAVTKVGAGTLTLSGANTYSGTTTVNAGTLALGSSGSLNSASSVSIAAGATFDVSAITTYTWGASAGLTASGTGTAVGTSAAAIKGGTTVSLGSRPITLTYDGSNPALYISQGTLSLNGNAFTVNGSALNAGTYVIVQQASGNITSAGTYPAVTGAAIGSGKTGSISVSSGNVVLTVQNTTTTALTRTAGASPSTYGSSLTFHAVVSPDPGNGSTITFKTNGVSFGTANTTSGAADLTISTLPYSGGSAYTVTADFGGNANNTSSSGSLTGGQQVNKATATVVVTPYSVTYDGSPHTATVTSITGVNGETGATVGTVDVSGTTHTAAGTYSSDSWSFTGTANYNNIGSTTITDTIGKATPTLSVDNSPVTYNGSAQAASVSGSVAGIVSNVKYDDSSTVPTAAATYAITADFAPSDSGNYNSLADASAGNFVIQKAASTLTLASSQNPSGFKGGVYFTATDLPTDTAVSVVFKTNNVVFDTQSLVSGSATSVTTTNLPRGANSITAEYTGDGNYIGSTNSITQTVTNHLPVANAKTYGVAQGETIVISLSNGAKSLATDADSDTLTITSLGDTNAVDFGTANITGGGASITYENTSGSAGDVALFSYNVSDGFGGLATNSVSIQISPATGANLVSAAAGDGNAYLTYAGIPGTNYALDHATSIVAPITWTPVLTNAAQTNGFLRFTNNLSMYPTNDFYRTRYVP